MNPIIPRSCPRTDGHVPIQYALFNSDQFEPASTFNYSPEGLCYETRHRLEPETEVCIVMDDYAPDKPGPGAYRSYVARIRWNHLLSRNGNDRYMAGAQIVARSHDILLSEEQLPHLPCDLCGDLTPIHRIHHTRTGAQMCHPCIRHFSKIPSEKIRQCVERFLVGNVV